MKKLGLIFLLSSSFLTYSMNIFKRIKSPKIQQKMSAPLVKPSYSIRDLSNYKSKLNFPIVQKRNFSCGNKKDSNGYLWGIALAAFGFVCACGDSGGGGCDGC